MTLADAPADAVLQADHQRRIGGDDAADHAIGVFRRGGGHQVLREPGGELAEHHGAQQSAEGEADQPLITQQEFAHGQERHGLRVEVTQAALAPAPVGQGKAGAQAGRQHERQADIQLRQPGAEKRADRVADIGQGVLDGKRLAAFSHRQQVAKAGFDRDIDHRIGQVDRHQAQVEQPQLAGEKGAEKAQGVKAAEDQDQQHHRAK